jgi:ABC-type transport system substrate-binding protein
MRRYLPVVILVILSVLFTACAPATPQVITVEKEVIVEREKVVTVEVEKAVEVEKVVKETVMVETERVVEKEVEKEVVVTATAVPPTVAPAIPTEKQIGGTLNVWQPNGWPEPSWLHLSNWESQWAISPMSDKLFWPLADGTMEPMMATGYDVSDDGLVYTLYLREGVKWHDGVPFTADDVVYSLDVYYDPAHRPLSPVRYGRTVKGLLAYNAGEVDTIEGVKKIDDYTVEFTLDTPDAGLPRLFWTYYPFSSLVPKHAVEVLDEEEVLQGTAAYWTDGPIGTGPYKFVQYVTDQYIEFERNEDYWDGMVGPEKLFLKISSPEVAVVMLQKGELDLMNPLQPTEVGRLSAEPNVTIVEAENNAQYYGLEMNSYTEDGLWTNPKAKQAFLYSIDRQAYVDTILQGYGVVRHSHFDGSAYACPTLTEYNYDPVKADELWTEVIGDKAARAEITIDLMSWLGMKARMDFLPIAQEYLRQQGFKVNVDIIDNALIIDYLEGQGPRGPDFDFNVLLYGPGVDPGACTPWLTPDSPTNVGYRGWPFRPDPDTGLKPDPYYYDNPRVAELLVLAAEETDPEVRKTYFQEIDCIWNVELPSLMTASPSFLIGTSTRLQGLDWQTNAALGTWTTMYRPGDWWIWQQ